MGACRSRRSRCRLRCGHGTCHGPGRTSLPRRLSARRRRAVMRSSLRRTARRGIRHRRTRSRVTPHRGIRHRDSGGSPRRSQSPPSRHRRPGGAGAEEASDRRESPRNPTAAARRADTMAVFAIGPPREDTGGYGGSSPREITAAAGRRSSRSRRSWPGGGHGAVRRRTGSPRRPSRTRRRPSRLYILAPRLSTLASLCWRASWAVSVVQASAARTPGTLFEAICSPLPEPPITMPRLPGSPMTPSAARITKTG